MGGRAREHNTPRNILYAIHIRLHQRGVPTSPGWDVERTPAINKREAAWRTPSWEQRKISQREKVPTFYADPKSRPEKAVTSGSEGNRERILVLVLNLGKKSQTFRSGTWGPKKSLAP